MRQPDHFMFYSETVNGNMVALDAEETAHLVAVLRAKEGEAFQVTDGCGAIYTCTLVNSDRHGSMARIDSTVRAKPLSPRVSVYLGLPERDELEWAIEALVPLGVAEIIPVICTRCQKKWWTPSWEKHETRLKRKAVAALKQSLNPFMPALSEPILFSKALEQAPGRKLAAGLGAQPLLSLPADVRTYSPVSCFIGPPGGFSEQEMAQLADAGALMVGLSSHRLRTELAAVAMCSMMQCS